MRAHRGERRRIARAGADAAYRSDTSDAFFYSQVTRVQRVYRKIVFYRRKNGDPDFRGPNREDRRKVQFRDQYLARLREKAGSTYGPWTAAPIPEWVDREVSESIAKQLNYRAFTPENPGPSIGTYGIGFSSPDDRW